MRNPYITAENLYSVVSNPIFNCYKIRIAKSGNIKIELEPAYFRYKGLYGYKVSAVEYTIGYTKGIGYWLRRQGNSGSTFPLHYNRDTHKYGFNTFKEAEKYLEKLFINKYFYIRPV